MNYYSVSHRLIPRDSEKYSRLSANLVSARMAMTPERYTFYGLLVSLFGGIIFAVFGFFVSLTITMNPTG